MTKIQLNCAAFARYFVSRDSFYEIIDTILAALDNANRINFEMTHYLSNKRGNLTFLIAAFIYIYTFLGIQYIPTIEIEQ